MCDCSLASRSSSHALMISLCQESGKPASPFVERETLPSGTHYQAGQGHSESQIHRMSQLGSGSQHTQEFTPVSPRC